MGRHGAFTRHVHDLSRTIVYTGPAFDLTKAISDAGNGGQILMTAETGPGVRVDRIIPFLVMGVMLYSRNEGLEKRVL